MGSASSRASLRDVGIGFVEPCWFFLLGFSYPSFFLSGYTCCQALFSVQGFFFMRSAIAVESQWGQFMARSSSRCPACIKNTTAATTIPDYVFSSDTSSQCAYPCVSLLWLSSRQGYQCCKSAPLRRISNFSHREMRSRANDLKDAQPTWRGNTKGKIACWESG